MPSTVLIDTDVLIDVARGSATMSAFLEDVEASHLLAASVITRMELIVGCGNKNELRELGRFLRRFRVVALTERSGEEAAALLERYRLSHGLQIPDALIAATAMAEGMPLLTRNLRHYRHIAGLDFFPIP